MSCIAAKRKGAAKREDSDDEEESESDSSSDDDKFELSAPSPAVAPKVCSCIWCA